MSVLSRKRIRLFADQATRDDEYMEDVYTNATPVLWRGNDVQFEIGLGHDGSIITDISNLASLTLDVKPWTNRNGDALITKTLDAADLSDITQANWDDKTAQHALVTLTGDETNIDVGEDNEDKCWLVISMVTNDDPGHSVTLQATKFRIVEDGTGSAGQTQNNASTYYTKAEADARYQQKHADGASIKFVDGKHAYIYCADDDNWYPLVVNLVDGAPVLGLGDAQ